MTKNSRLVYSTDQGRIRPSEEQASSAVPASDGIVRLSRESKGRKGKGVTLITGVSAPADELKALAKQLKQQCGVGGSVKNGVIEIQTDDRDKLKSLLESLGHKVKIAGG